MDTLNLDPRLRDTGADDRSIVVSGAQSQPLSAPIHHLNTVDNSTTSGITPQTETSIDSPASNGPSPAGAPAPGYGGPNAPHTPSGNPISVHSGTPSFDPATGAPHDPNDPKRPRACEACRGLKVRCEPDPANPDGPCKRCAKAGRQCIVTQPTRKRQKKTDSRVAELERKIDALTASLQAQRGGGSLATPSIEATSFAGLQYGNTQQRAWGSPPVQRPFSQPERPSSLSGSTIAGQKRKFAETGQTPADLAKDLTASTPSRNGQESAGPDAIDRGVLTMDQANEFLRRYTDQMAPHLPIVVFPDGISAEELRRTKPILFLAILAAASSEHLAIQRQLSKELTQIFADRIVIRGQKSLELVQALHLAVIWYFPPEHFEELKFYQFVHMSAVMAIDLGLGRRRNNPQSRLIPYNWREHPFRKNPLPDPSLIESRRAWLACYFLASNTAMALHRPNLIRWTPFMTECIDILESSPEAAPTDKYLCHLVWTHRLAEEVGIQFSMDDPHSYVNVAEPKIQYALRGFERDLAKYSDSVPKSEQRASLIISFHVLSLYMHEIALYVDKTDDVRTVNIDALREPLPGPHETLTAAHISALSACLTAIDGILNTFLDLDVESIRCLPVFNFVRVAYAVVVLLKMYFSASTPNSELGKVIDKDNMKVVEYLDKLLEKFRQTAEEEKSRPAAKFLLVLVMLRSWLQKQGKGPGGLEQIGPHPPQGSEGATVPKAGETPAAGAAPQEQQQANEYNTANTPLQLLSEVATGNGAARGATQTPSSSTRTAPSQPPSSTQSQAQSYPWASMQPPSGPNPAFLYDSSTGAPTPSVTGDTIQPTVPMPYLNPSFTADFDYSALGDGFEQAMGLTLGGPIVAGGDGTWDPFHIFLSDGMWDSWLEQSMPVGPPGSIQGGLPGGVSGAGGASDGDVQY